MHLSDHQQVMNQAMIGPSHKKLKKDLTACSEMIWVKSNRLQSDFLAVT